MNSRRVLQLLRGGVMSGTRSPAVLWLVIMPFAITFLLRVVFATLLDPKPRITILDTGSSRVTGILEASEEVDLSRVNTGEELAARVENSNADLGLTVPAGFDRAVSRGEKPLLDLAFSAEAAPSTRIVIFLLLMDIVRDLEGGDSPLKVVMAGDEEEEAVPLQEKLVPAVVLMVLIVAGIFTPAFLLVQEKESGTIMALLVTPVRLMEIIVSKALLGYFLTFSICVITLALNGTLGSGTAPLLLTVAAGAGMCVPIGIIYGCLAPDAKTLYTLVKSLNLLLIGPVAFYFIPSIPGWLARFFPTYWFIDPLYMITLENAGLNRTGGKLAAAAVLGIALWFPAVVSGKRMHKRLAGR